MGSLVGGAGGVVGAGLRIRLIPLGVGGFIDLMPVLYREFSGCFASAAAWILARSKARMSLNEA